MYIEPIKAYNLLRNYDYETALAIVMRDYDPKHGAWMLAKAYSVATNYKDELSRGMAFMVAFNEQVSIERQTNIPDMPASMKRLSNFSKALFKFVVEGLPVATREEAQKKLVICETNECGFYDGSICRNAKCGCFTKIKAFFETEHCPIGKW